MSESGTKWELENMRSSASANKISFREAVVILGVVCACLLTSCQTITSPQAEAEPVYKFTVLLYPEPVEVSSWVVDPAQAANPEGEALSGLDWCRNGNR
jgi:hypothetical protein